MRALAFTALALAACGGGGGTPPDGPIDAIAGPLPDAAMCPTSTGFPAQLVLGPMQGSVANPFTVQITGSGSSQIGAVSLAADVGTVAIGGAAQTSFVYMTVPFGGYQLYQGFAVGASRWDVFWMYCNSNGTNLSNIYDEGVDGPLLFVEGASGSCNGAMTATTTQVTLPASMIASPTSVYTGYVVDGTKIHIASNGIGSVTLGGATMPLVVFGTVDCRTACGSPGWFELHSVVWDAAHQRTIFVIVYLESGAPGSVLLTYARALPDLSDPIGSQGLSATWNPATDPPCLPARPPVIATLRPAGPPFGVPPPRH
jgi:hypothetical protein